MSPLGLLSIFEGPLRSMMVRRLGWLIAVATIARCAAVAAPPESSVIHPDWSRDAVIYEVNVRQFTPSGTFRELETHLPRLQKLGVKIVWLMPVHPIGEQGRKGTLGSYYSVRDYRAVNPEFGTMADFKRVVTKAHELGMFVILDWVANHCAWDNPLVKEHPDWFTRDSTGNMVSPVADWSDVVDFDFSKPELREYMIESMKFWIRETDVDGFRCDVAGMVPLEFWNALRPALESVKPVFMLAEDENPAHHSQAFDATYGWELVHLMPRIVKGEQPASSLAAYFVRNRERYPVDAYRMYFTDNHDENSWNGTVEERLGLAARAFAVLAATASGIPLIYSGQESGLNRRLKFFEKDSIDWKDYPLQPFYEKLLSLKRTHPALGNGASGGTMRDLQTADSLRIYAFEREKEGRRVCTILNLSPDSTEFRPTPGFQFRGHNLFDSQQIIFEESSEVLLEPWGYRVWVSD